MKRKILRVIVSVLLALSLTVSLSGCVKIDGETIPKNTTWIDLSGRGLTDVSPLKGLKNLTYLDIRGNYITSRQFDELQAALPGCEIVWSVPIGTEYYDSDISDIAVAADYVDDLYALRYFTCVSDCDVSGTRADDQRLYELAQSMPEKNIYWTTDIGTGEISTNTERLDLSEKTINDPSVLRYFTNLKELRLRSYQLEDLSPIAGLTGLEALDISGNRIGDLSVLSGMSSLRELDIYGCESYEVIDFSVLENLTSLEALDIGMCYGTNYEVVTKLNNLKRLNMSHIINLKDDHSFLSNLPQTLEELTLDGCHLRNDDIRHLTGLKNLKKLSLMYIPVYDLSPFYELPELEELTLTGYKLTDEQIAELEKALPDCEIRLMYV